MIVPPIIRPLLRLPAKIYEWGVRARIAGYEAGWLETRRLVAPVVSVGNLSFGGTGKTPCTAFIARYLRAAGFDVAVLSRGYRRKSAGVIEVADDRAVLCGPRAAGDEPYLLARSCPGVRVMVGADRFAAGRWLEARAAVSAFILDDGFQHLALARALNLLLLDATEPIAAARMPPFGRLREPLAGMRRADAVIVTRADQPFDRVGLIETVARHCRPDTPLFFAQHEMTSLRRLNDDALLAATTFAGHPVAAVSGIAKPQRFVADLQAVGMRIVLRRDCADHHRYSPAEWAEIVAAARAARAEAIITTEKDAANLPPNAVPSSLPIYAAQIEFRCADEAALKELILRAISS